MLATFLMVAEQGSGKSYYLERKPCYDFCDTELLDSN